MSKIFLSDINRPNRGFTAQNTFTQFLKFQLDPDIKAMLPIERITEVLKLQLSQIVPIPHLPAWVMGVYNWRGNILWMVDLSHLIGLSTRSQQQHNFRQTAIVLSPDRQQQSDRLSGIHLGLVVARVEDLIDCDPSTIQPAIASQGNPTLNNFLQGYWLDKDKDTILSLDSAKIALAMPAEPN